jgi:hypothetical protein
LPVRLYHKIYCEYVVQASPSIFNCNRFPGDRSEREPPVPIPNTEVKPLSPDGTARATAWESRKSPGLIKGAKPRSGFARLFNKTPRSDGGKQRVKPEAVRTHQIA